MAITLKADNRELTKDQPYSYMLNNYASGVSAIVIGNSADFSTTDYVLFGNIGSSNSEIVQISTITSASHTLNLVAATKFAHSESTRVTLIRYNKVRYFWTATPAVPNPAASPIIETTIDQNVDITTTTVKTTTHPNTATYTKASDPTESITVDITPPILFNTSNPLALINIAADQFYTNFSDTLHTTGYGWFAFYNETGLVYSSVSNAIPYGGFAANTVREIFKSFDSQLNQKELRLISMDDKYSWLRKAHAIMVNHLNLGNWEYKSSGPLTLTIVQGVTEYLLPEDFSDMLYINESNGDKIGHYDQTFEPPQTSMVRQYEIRGRYLVFRPSPDSGGTVTFAYLKCAKPLNDLSDVVDLPANAYENIMDYMLYRAYRKLGNLTEAANSKKEFDDGINLMKIVAVRRDNGLDSWSVDNSQNV